MPGVGGERRSERSLGANDDPQFPIEGFLFLCGKTSLTSKRVITSDGELEDDEERDDDGNADDRGRLESEGCAADELDDGVTAEGGTDRGDAMDGGISRRLPVRRGRRTGGDSVDDGDFSAGYQADDERHGWSYAYWCSVKSSRLGSQIRMMLELTMMMTMTSATLTRMRPGIVHTSDHP